MSKVYLLKISSDEGLRDLELEVGDYVLGRSKKVDISITDRSLSRKHLKITLTDESISIEDLGTTNGTFVNGDKIAVNEKVQIENNDSVTFGDTNIELSINPLVNEHIGEQVEVEDQKENVEQLADKRKKRKRRNSSTQDGVRAIRRNERMSHFDGNLALRSSSQIFDDSHNIEEVVARANDQEQKKISEIELLEIKRLELESQVKALKIKEEAEAEAKLILDKAKSEAQKLLVETETEAKKVLNEALLESDDILDEAEEEAEELINEAEEEVDLKRDRVLKFVEEQESSTKQKCDDLLKQAENKAYQILESAKTESAELKKETQEKVDKILLESKIEREKFVLEKEKELSNLARDVEREEKSLGELRKNITTFSEQLNFITSNKQKVELELEEVQRKNKSEKELSEKITSELSELQKNLREKEIEYTELINGLSDSKSKFEGEISKLTKKIDSKKSEKSDLENECLKLNGLIAEIDEKREKAEKYLDASLHEKKELTTLLKQLNEERQELLTSTEGLKKSEGELLESIRQHEQELEDIDKKVKNYFNGKKKAIDKELELKRKEEYKKLEEAKKETSEKISLLLEQAETKAKKREEEAEINATKREEEADEVYRVASVKESKAEELLEQIEADQINERQKLDDEIKTLKEEALLECKTSQEKALKEYEETIVLAKEKSEKIINEAKDEAKEFYENSRSELSNAQSKANEVIQYAQEKAKEIQENGLKHVESEKSKILEEVEKFKDERKNLVESNGVLLQEITQLQDSIQEQKENFALKIKEKEESILKKANENATLIENKANNILAEAQDHAEKIKNEKIAEGQKVIEKAREEEKKRLAEQAQKEKELLGKLRTQEMENLKIRREQEERDFHARKEEYIDTMVKGVENLVINALKSKGNPGDAFDVENLGYLVRACLLDKRPEDNQLLKKLNPYGNSGQGKSNKFWKKVGIGVGAVVFLLIIHLSFPDLFGSMFSSVGDSFKVENSAKDLYMEDLKQQEKSKYSFNPKMSDSYKKSLVENVLYTNRFNELFLNDEFQKKWTIKVDESIVYKLKLKDYKVVDYISIEFKLVRDLINMRAKINQMNKEDKIAEMKKREEEGRKELLKLLESKVNLKILDAARKAFFIKYKNSH